jgi:hypothetical protein
MAKVWEASLRERATSSNNDLVDIGIDYEVCVVSNHDDLASTARALEQPYELRLDKLRVQVLLWLVND